ncbi:hypothetical protein FB381_2622 [Nocardioides albertanoniae]|uniref:Cobyrinic acid a,c-diamide synthase n=1 Tax=Nocardioides albertanoniae TaxID=1175486 RepID=A0A543A803_9ACTN|nr:hypothetical protein [Nocardioides albertanoniae]TQL68725.1 hypothetical protein FB381_2622 [Nocardioides albertanoniae]
MATRRVRVPAADDLFRRTSDGAAPAASAGEAKARPVHAVPEPDDAQTGKKRSSGRVRHDEKMTVYITSGELLDLEHARLSLRAKHGIAVDRGRLVREALAIVLADLEEYEGDSALVHRLGE